ncbi:MAG: hypothetical protein IJ724_12615 [Muribaculaceae bacterium]|nr:hypothetical protein [Muribaculaceae bacterium]
MDKIVSKPIGRFKKGDAFVVMTPSPVVFLEVNEVEEGSGNKGFYIVTRYSLDENGPNIQQRFPMVAVDDKFCNFEPISCKILKEVKRLVRQYDAEAKQLVDKKETKKLYQEYNRKLIELLPDAEVRQALAQQVKKEIVTNKWLDCENDNFGLEEDLGLNDKYATLVYVTSEPYDGENNKTITDQAIYLRDNSPFGWGILVKSGAKYMVIEKP